MRAHLLQYDIAWEDKPANHETVRRLLEGVNIASGDLLVLPEMFDTGFSMRTEITARDPEFSLGFVSQIAREHAVYAVASIAHRLDAPDNNGRDCVNRAHVLDPEGRPLGHADKVHPFSFGRESERFVGGRDVLVAKTDACSLCPIVCYDLRFPECFRAGVDKGAEVFPVIANWPDARADHYRTLCIARAIENQAFVLGLNRCGDDPKLSYAGGSLAVDPMGRVLAEAGADETVLSVDLDLDALHAWRERFPALRDRKGWRIGPEESVCDGQ